MIRHAGKKERNLTIHIAIKLMGLMIPLVLLLNIYAAYIIRTIDNRKAELDLASLDQYCNKLDNTMTSVAYAVLDIETKDLDYAKLSLSQNDVEKQNSIYEILLKMKSLLQLHPQTAAILFKGADGRFIPSYASWFSGVFIKDEIATWMKDLDKGEWANRSSEWEVLLFNGSEFLCRTFAYKGNTMAVIIDLEYIAKLADYPIAFINDGEYITQKEKIVSNKISLPSPSKMYTISGDTMLLSKQIDKTTLTAVYLVPYKRFLGSRAFLGMWMFIISFLTILIIPITYFWLSKVLFHPLKEFVSAMGKIGKGEQNIRLVSEYRDKEFRIMGETFNYMLDEIQEWKIAYYEEEISKKQALMDFMQLQIRPHFYINCLKNIYSMLQEKNYDDIQDMLIVMSDYLRYMMQCGGRVTTLQEELKNIRSYIRLQQYNLAYPPIYEEQVEEELLNINIPPISILTFVENCIKHNNKKKLEITIKGNVVRGDNEIAILTIRDNGEGFSRESLYALNHLEEQNSTNNHIGISNTVFRLKMSIGSDCEVAFSNNQGAQVDIFFTIGNKEVIE